MAWAVGDILQRGRYRIESILGEGGFGITYGAWDSHRAEQVVIKVLNDSILRDPDYPRFEQSFINEALQLARCRHPHVVKVEEVIREGERWCIVMEFIRGQTLHQLLQRRGPLPLEEALRFTQEVGSALSTLHEQGILHRDVKPANIMVRAESNQAVLIDFGLARGFTQGSLQRHTSYGTDGYAPLEQYDTWRRRGAFMDVYALAATLYTMLTGAVPLCAPVRATGRELDPPQRLNPQIPERVSRAIEQGMALKWEDRPQTIAEWLQLLLEDPSRTPQNSLQEMAPKAAATVSPGSLNPSQPPSSPQPVSGIHTQDLRELQQILAEPEPQDELERLLRDHSAEELERIVSPPTPVKTPSDSGVPVSPAGEMGSRPSPVMPSWPEWVGEAAPALQGLWERLQAGQWQEADRWTSALMLKLSGRSASGYFAPEDVLAFPCPMLRLLDQLWVQASHGRFGFSIQKQVWQGFSSTGRVTSGITALLREEQMAEKVGWWSQGRWLAYTELKTSLEAPKGHLPIGFFWGYAGGLRSALLLLDQVVLKKWNACL